MRLIEIGIRNLKSITQTDIVFPVDGVSPIALIYGDNGAGKTSVLEAVSLLGHLSTMSRMCKDANDPETIPSVFRVRKNKLREAQEQFSPDKQEKERWLRESAEDKHIPRNFEHIQENVKNCTTLEQFWANCPKGGGAVNHATIRFRVSYNNDDLEFFVVFLQHIGLSITESLSKDQKTEGGRIHDGNMDNWFVMICDNANRIKVDSLVNHMLDVSPHSYWNELEDYKTERRSRNRREIEDKEIVAYWNTDLNDFGRKNDLRESVKKIRLDLEPVLVSRLGVSLLDDRDPKNIQYIELRPNETITAEQLTTLNRSLGDALIDHTIATTYAFRKQKQRRSLQINRIDLKAKPAEVMVQRMGDLTPTPIDHLSAGENETVFILFLMNGMPVFQSILLLDEPDLHLSEYAKPVFFKTLYGLAEKMQCQLILATHSAFAFAPRGSSVERYFLRVEQLRKSHGTEETIVRSSWDDRFGELLTFHYARNAVNAMREAGFFWRWLSVPLQAFVWVGQKLGLPTWYVLTAFLIAVDLYCIGAMINDVWLRLSGRDLNEAELLRALETHETVITYMVVACSVLFVGLVLGRLWTSVLLPRNRWYQR